MLEAAAKLPDDQRGCFSCSPIIDGLSIAEIAEALEVPKNTAKTRLFRAREKMRAALSIRLEDDVNDAEETSEPLGEMVDLERWEPQLPPGDFAERLPSPACARRITPRRRRRPRRRSRARAGGQRWPEESPPSRSLPPSPSASRRRPRMARRLRSDWIEVAIGSRALAVLEPGASVRWDGDDVVQARGDVFYRVEPGARFAGAHAGVGDVEAKGTCFAVKVRPVGSGEGSREEADMQKRDVKVGAVGAALSALAFVAVYEGKVAVSHASERVDLRAGETAQSGAGGVKRTGTTAEGEKAFDSDVALAQSGDDAISKANQNLVSQVEPVPLAPRRDCEAEVGARGAAREDRGEAHRITGRRAVRGEARLRSPADDWKDLAKDGTVKYQMPCINVKNDVWSPSPEKLNKLGLAPQDGAVIKNAYAHSSQRVWAAIKPLCAQAIGSAEVAEKTRTGHLHRSRPSMPRTSAIARRPGRRSDRWARSKRACNPCRGRTSR